MLRSPFSSRWLCPLTRCWGAHPREVWQILVPYVTPCTLGSLPCAHQLTIAITNTCQGVFSQALYTCRCYSPHEGCLTIQSKQAGNSTAGEPQAYHWCACCCVCQPALAEMARRAHIVNSSCNVDEPQGMTSFNPAAPPGVSIAAVKMRHPS